ncbi:MAG: hypothetical protein HVN35_01255 [Methanobacteriaceae archaeon]|nr:hypothetical protein [Methanobacteriaceae archaeon]
MKEYQILGNKIQMASFITEINDPNKTINMIQDVSSRCNNGNCTIQIINAQGIAGEKHLLQAIYQALKAFDRGENISKDLGLEICVRASFQRQISRALQILGIKKGENSVYVLVINGDNQVLSQIMEILGKNHEEVFEVDTNINTLKNIYKVNDKEIAAAGNIERVMIERTALLSLEI